MKNINKDIIKSIGISILVVIAIILILLVVCYDKISISKVIPKVDEYELSEELKNELGYEETEKNEMIITTYELDASDLRKYEKTKEYNKGKKDPFSIDTTEPNGNSSTENNQATSSNENFYEDEGIK